MELRTVRDLHDDVLHNLWKIPLDVDVIVGIPRSGMLAGSMVALARNLPLVDLEGFCAGRVFETGTTRRRAGEPTAVFKHPLIVDDSSRTGTAMTKALAQVRTARPDVDTLTSCVVYGNTGIAKQLDIVMSIIDKPRIFEWNVMHHPHVLRDACLDIDGVLCHDPTLKQNDDGDGYLAFLQNAQPMYLPSHPIGYLVTSRLEKYRAQTEAWLDRHGVHYGRLVMLDLPNAQARREAKAHGSFKAEFYAKSPATLFIESELKQAQEIARTSGKPALSLEGPVMCTPNTLSTSAVLQRVRNRRVLGVWLRALIGDYRFDRLKATLLRRS